MNEMDVANIKQGSNIVIIGARNTGKSTLVKKILRHFPSDGTIVCGSEEWNPVYGTKHTEMTRALVSESLTRVFLVLDDCIYDNAWINEVFESKAKEQTKPTLIITMLYAMSIPADAIINYVFIFRETIQSNLRKMYERYGGSVFSDFTQFCQAIQNLEDYECLVIENKTTAYHFRNKNK